MIFLRHPVPDAKPGLCYGRMDIGLGPDAADQIAAALQVVPRGRPILSSPAKRCMALAEPLAARDGQVLQKDPRLWEIDFGTWEGQLWDDVPRSESDPWADDVWNISPPGGESFRQVASRVEAALADADEASVIVAHAGVIRAAKVALFGYDLDRTFAEQIPYATPLRLEQAA